jgi:hypothetical protein
MNSHHTATSSSPLEAGFEASIRLFNECGVWQVTPSTAAISTHDAAQTGAAPAPVATV